MFKRRKPTRHERSWADIQAMHKAEERRREREATRTGKWPAETTLEVNPAKEAKDANS